MQKLENLIPKDKFDIETVELLYGYSFDELEPIIPRLLEWLQDGNWPVSRPLGIFLKTMPSDKIAPYIMDILNGKDFEWKYFVIIILGSGDKSKIDQSFLDEIKRLAFEPTEIEIKCDLQEIALLALE